MRRAERVVFALGALGEAGQAAALAQRADAVAPAGEDLVRIGLMADVPDQPVARGVEDVMQRDGELDDAEAGAEMPAGDRDRVDRFLAQFVRRAGEGPFPEDAAGLPGRGPGRAGGILTLFSPLQRPGLARAPDPYNRPNVGRNLAER